jgi:hypothetical protein
MEVEWTKGAKDMHIKVQGTDILDAFENAKWMYPGHKKYWIGKKEITNIEVNRASL